jgi:hypothetical protein
MVAVVEEEEAEEEDEAEEVVVVVVVVVSFVIASWHGPVILAAMNRTASPGWTGPTANTFAHNGTCIL